MISNSGKDENGRYTGGIAGDQGGEWTIINWYNRPWNCVLRHPDVKVAEKLAELSRKAANNNLIGYDQNERYTYWNHLVASNYDPSQITVKCEADCSAGVIANTRAVGYLMGIPSLQNINATYTGNMRNGYKVAGFIILTESKYLTSDAYLLPGDILLNDKSHVAVNLDKGSKVTVPTSSVTSTSTNTGKATDTVMGMKLTDIAKYVNAEFGNASGKNYNCLLGVAQCMKDMMEVGGYGNTLSAVLKNNFTKPSSTYTEECLQAVKDVFVNGKLRFDNARILQFRSFSKYSDGKGNPDKNKCASVLAKYDYLGSDYLSMSLGHLYFGKKLSTSTGNFSTNTSTQSTILKKGTTGSAVKTLQKMLNKVGFNLVVDGDFGSKTDVAVRKFQRDNGLIVDGEYGTKSKAVLEKLIAEKEQIKNSQSSSSVAYQYGIADKADPKLTGTYTTTSDLYMRYKAGIKDSKNVVTILPLGAKVQCYQYYTVVDNVKWLYVAYGNKVGFVSSDYLKKIS